jgi:hypothetical protein
MAHRDHPVAPLLEAGCEAVCPKANIYGDDFLAAASINLGLVTWSHEGITTCPSSTEPQWSR